MRLSILGLVGVLAGAISAPAFAGTPASISGSVTFVTPAGFTSTNSAESILPSGFQFGATGSPTNTFIVPQYNLIGFSIATTSLSIGSSGAVTANTSLNSFSGAAAQVLANAAAATSTNPNASLNEGRATGLLNAATYFSGNIDFIAAIIKAGAGVNGLD